MVDDETFKQAIEDHEVAYFRGRMAIDCPESYSLEEMKEISEGMDASTEEVEALMRKDFQSMPPEMQKAMLNMLTEVGPESKEFWEGILLG